MAFIGNFASFATSKWKRIFEPNLRSSLSSARAVCLCAAPSISQNLFGGRHMPATFGSCELGSWSWIIISLPVEDDQLAGALIDWSGFWQLMVCAHMMSLTHSERQISALDSVWFQWDAGKLIIIICPQAVKSKCHMWKRRRKKKKKKRKSCFLLWHDGDNLVSVSWVQQSTDWLRLARFIGSAPLAFATFRSTFNHNFSNPAKFQLDSD